MAFSKIRPQTRRGRKEDNSDLFVTMRNNGILHLNTSTYEVMGQPEYVTLLVDEDTNDFAIQPVDEKVSGEYILTVRQPNPNASGHDISSQSLMKERGLIDGALHRYVGEWDENENMLIVRLSSEVVRTVNSSNGRVGRKRKARNDVEEFVTAE